MLSFTEWRASRQQAVVMRPFMAIEGLGPIVDEYLSRYEPRRNQCFDNAIILARHHPEVLFVVGRTSNVQSEHAWNSFRGIHFDITAEVPYFGRFEYGKYTQIAALNFEEARRAAVLRIAPMLADIYHYEYMVREPLNRKIEA